MKNLQSLLFMVFCVAMISCGDEPLEDLENSWNLTNLSGGIAGLNCNIDEGDYVWTFDKTTLTRELGMYDPTCTNLPMSDAFEYKTKELENVSYLTLDGEDFGEISISDNTMTINTNSLPNGTGNDGFVYSFTLVE